ncbi:hypothetical protein [Bacillus phage SPO1L4]|nr:hypothetical protein [Bacillus phage SPO1L4]
MLKTAKEVREAKASLHPTTDRVRSTLREIQEKIDDAVLNNKSSINIKFPCGDSKEERGKVVVDLTEVVGTLRSYGYSASLGPTQDKYKNPLWVIYCSF